MHFHSSSGSVICPLIVEQCVQTQLSEMRGSLLGETAPLACLQSRARKFSSHDGGRKGSGRPEPRLLASPAPETAASADES